MPQIEVRDMTAEDEYFVNGKEIGWGYEAPKDGIREAIEKAMKELQE